jgi:hypothetical protein
MNGPGQERRDCGSPAVLAPRRVLASRTDLVAAPTGRAHATKPHSSGRNPSGRNPSGRAPAPTRVRTLVPPNKEPQS